MGKKLQLVVFIISYILFIICGVLLLVELITDPDIIGISLMIALTSGFYTIQKAFKEKVKPRKESKFKGRIRRRF